MITNIVRESVCDKLTDKIDFGLNTLRGSQNAISKTLNETSNALSKLSFDPAANIDGMCADVLNNMNSFIPDLSDFDELVDIINACNFLYEDKMLSHPTALVSGLSKYIKDNVWKHVNMLTANCPEFNAARIFDLVANSFLNKQIGFVLPDILKSLGCVNAICGRNMTSQLESISSFQNTFFFNPDGELNISDVLESQGITAQKKENILKAKNTLMTINKEVDARIIGAKTYLKSSTLHVI